MRYQFPGVTLILAHRARLRGVKPEIDMAAEFPVSIGDEDAAAQLSSYTGEETGRSVSNEGPGSISSLSPALLTA